MELVEYDDHTGRLDRRSQAVANCDVHRYGQAIYQNGNPSRLHEQPSEQRPPAYYDIGGKTLGKHRDGNDVSSAKLDCRIILPHRGEEDWSPAHAPEHNYQK